MRKKTGRLLAFGLILCLLAGFGAAAAGGMHTEVGNDTLDVEVQLGYDGKITFGKPVPVRVTVRNHGDDLEGILAVNAYVSTLKYDRYETEISVPAGGERTVVLAVTAQTKQDIFTAEIVQDGKVTCAINASPKSLINPSAMMIGLISTRPRNLANLDITQENDMLNRYEYWQTVALTPETVPDDPELLDAFGMIVLDDTDPALLTEKQQEALKKWVREGHVLLCGGGTAAPRNLAFLGEMTTLRAEDFTVSAGVHAALESYAGRKATGRHPETALAKITGGHPLVSDEDGNGLIWRMTAGNGRVYVLAWEAGDAVLNTESLMHLFYQQMLIKSDLTLYNTILYTQSSSNALYSPGEGTPVKVRNTLPAAAAIVVAAAVIGLVLWIMLNRHGASKWMWAGIPLIALAAAAAIAFLAGNSMLNRPVASATVNIVQTTDGRTTYFTAVSAAAPKAGIHRYSMDGEELRIQSWDDSYWMDEEEEDKPREPGTLRIIHTTGKRSEISVNASSPWQTTELNAVRAAEETGKVRAEIWMEEDGLHGTVYNGTEYGLKEGAVLCVWGYARIPALAPGESAEFAMIAEEISDPFSPVFEDGKMLKNATSSMYTVVNQMWFGMEETRYDSRESILAGMMSNAANQLTWEQNQKTGSYMETAIFMYCAEPETASAAAVYADGKEVESISVLPMLTAEAKYLAVGKTGVVFRAPGMDAAVRCELDEDGMPAGDMEDRNNGKYYSSYYPLSETPTFRFTPESIQEIEISSLIIGMEQWYAAEVRCYLLNVKQNRWVEIQLNQPLQRTEQYLDSDGNLYCQFRAASGEYYMEIPAPTLTLEGRAKDAST